MKASKIDRAFQKMPKMINVPQVNNFMSYQQPVNAQMYQDYQGYPGGQMMCGYPPQQAQFNGYEQQYPPQYAQYQQSQPYNPTEQSTNQVFAQEYTKYYIEYWNNYYESLKNGGDANDLNDFKEQSVSSINDRLVSDKKQQSQQEQRIDQSQERRSDSQKSKFGKQSTELRDNINRIKQAITEEVNEAKSELSINSDLLREEYRKKQYLPEEEDLIPVNQNFLLEQSITFHTIQILNYILNEFEQREEDDYDRYIPECKVEPSQKILEGIIEEERIQREEQEKIQREQEAIQQEKERKQLEAERQQKEEDQFYEDNPEVYLEHRKKQKKVIFSTLKLEMDRLIEKTMQVEEDLFEEEKGIKEVKKETESNNLKRKKAQFYLRAKKLQRDIDDIIVNNKEEELAETNFELLKGLHESVVDDQLERMYEKNQLLFLQVSQALQDIVGVKNKQGTFQSYNYYESLKQNARQEIKKVQQDMEKKKKLYGQLLPPQKSMKKNTISLSKDRKISNSTNRGKSQEKKSDSLHKKSWNQH